jgi:ribosomal protein S12 methylthiotransferase
VNIVTPPVSLAWHSIGETGVLSAAVTLAFGTNLQFVSLDPTGRYLFRSGKRLYELVDRLRKRVDGLFFRTAFIVGHPGESEAEFSELLDFVRYAEFDRVGVFRYSDEPSARSYQLSDKVPRGVASRRAKKLMSVQRAISRKHQRALIGRELEVLVEGPSDESDLVMSGRHAGQAPDIDGIVFLGGEPVLPGDLCRAHVVDASDYDLVADVIEKVPLPRAKAKVKASPLVYRGSDGRQALRVV